MIYVITPHLSDYMNVCRDKDFETKRRSRDNFAEWISSPIQFMGRRITEVDQIIYGYRYAEFPPNMVNKFNIEIAVRSPRK